MSESFAELFENSVEQQNTKIGALLMGTVVSINREKAVISVGLKSEAFISLDQFKDAKGELEIQEGDVVEVALESIDDGLGHTLLSREKAKRIKLWQSLETAMNAKEVVTGVVTGSVKGGLTVDIGVVKAFLPGSLVDTHPVKDFAYLIGQEVEAIVIKMDEVRNNIVISRKAVMQEANSADREALLETLEEGVEIEGVVKNLADYGAFVDLGGIDGLLHITDISWQRVNHPSEKLNIGDKIKVKVLNCDKEKMRVSLGLKQLTASPWDNISDRLPLGKKVSGTVSNLTDYGAFVRIEEGVEGLVHVSEMDWTNANARPSKFVKLGQEVDVVVLDVQESKHRISLSMKQAQENPWEAFEATHNKGDKIGVNVKSITDFGLFVGLPGGIDGLIHLADISWEKLPADELVSNYSKGQEFDVIILNIDAEKERISLGIKQLDEDDFMSYASLHKKGAIVKGVVAEVDSRGAVITLAEGITGYLKAGEISTERVDDVSTIFKVADEIEVAIVNIDRKSRNITVSIKAKDSAEEKAAMEDYNKQSSDTVEGATLGDLLKKAKN
ncbi:SSU ribosomal protein S1p [Bathymodiolus thermophilus thioautotrophic gill symbiont]|jgi:small subunit ribosomal protein S1|uniref:SSU ribosomal protein S1p n=4 Tax=sulfur-oxidizing symbionts TaxID=32036 RepID=A0ACA8ZMY8_9GAMM|nr:30S ribosomal protein S1 [Bathymodiolus thermophilus thioautotrophic gill symbiont]CAB5495328.1 SSU ribosomal protein S1p [Bathymodiolus azoricus thioautotrophic gill symbiont]CAC9511731.1 SSU ribosomal protein S1p [uncultured Gammaproteobacteria bacterium]CAB5500404.1 SSU ribosomal protein S1p [Bathymodiolus thermophilus thioautotrophic gill symbiont]CAC9520071.1 SSU ribosomal protein S1p [uncultured Gammaproteobacteria bacterium]CAC9525403.1 SSU ribosomal protein S1p [uncultured Gammaprot